MSITAGDLGLRVNWVHGEFSGTLGCLNGIMVPGITQTEKRKVSLIQMTGRWQCDEEVYCASCPLCLESIVLWGQRRARSGEWTYYPPFLQENITFRNNGEWICSQFPLKPVQGLWEIMQMKQVCKDVLRFVCFFMIFYHLEWNSTVDVSHFHQPDLIPATFSLSLIYNVINNWSCCCFRTVYKYSSNKSQEAVSRSGALSYGEMRKRFMRNY